MCRCLFFRFFFYERYPSAASVSIQYIEPLNGSPSECVTSHWFKLCSREPLSSVVDSEIEFVWRPYVTPKAGVDYSRFYDDKVQRGMPSEDTIGVGALILAISAIPGLLPYYCDCVYDVVAYNRHRLARQFGFD